MPAATQLTREMTNYKQLFAYEAWANQEALRSLLDARNPVPKAVRTMAHIIGASWLWHSRLLKQSGMIAVWPELRIDALSSELDKLHLAWDKDLNTLATTRLDEQIEYVNSKGEKWVSKVEDILTHLIMHSAYHRGQIAMLLRMGGSEPGYTDYIHAVRRKLIP